MGAGNPVHQYARDILSGEIIAGELVRLACERHLADLESGSERGLRFHWPEAERALAFMELLHYWKQGRWTRGRAKCTCDEDPDGCEQRIRWLPFQQFIVGSLFGWQIQDEDGFWVRRFLSGYLEMARKNTKSTMGNGVGLRCIFGEGEDKAEGYVIGVGKDQARYIHNIAKEMVKSAPRLLEKLMGYDLKLANIYNPNTGCFYEPLASDTNTLDSRGPHFALVDEYHEHPSAKSREDLATGMQGGMQPLELVITTAGLRVVGSPCKEFRDYCEAILRGVRQDDRTFALIYGLDRNDDWSDESCWIKANPALGHSVFIEGLRAKLEKAKADPEAELHFRTKNLSQWVGSASTYLPMEDWAACGELEVDLKAIRGRKCFVGVDLATKEDLTAITLLIPPPVEGGIWYLRAWCYLPEKMYEKRARRDETVKAWMRSGLIEVTPGSRTDYQAMRARLNEQAAVYEVVQVGVDPWNSSEIEQDLIQDGFDVIEVPQNMPNLTEATKKLKALVVDHRLAHGGDKVVSWAASNATAIYDTKDNMMLSRKHSADRYDPIAAGIIAMALKLEYTSPDQLGVGIVT